MNQPENELKLITIDVAARRLKVHRDTIRSYVRGRSKTYALRGYRKAGDKRLYVDAREIEALSRPVVV